MTVPAARWCLPGALMATLQYLPPSTSCWQPPAADTARTVSSLGTSPTWQSPTQLSPFDQSISSSYWRPLNLLLTLPPLPLFPPLWSSLSSSSSLPPYPAQAHWHPYFLPCLALSVISTLPTLSPGKPFFCHTLGPGSPGDTGRMSNNSSHWCHYTIIQPAEASLDFTGPGTTLSFRNTATSKAEKSKVSWSLHPIEGE